MFKACSEESIPFIVRECRDDALGGVMEAVEAAGEGIDRQGLPDTHCVGPNAAPAGNPAGGNCRVVTDS